MVIGGRQFERWCRHRRTRTSCATTRASPTTAGAATQRRGAEQAAWRRGAPGARPTTCSPTSRARASPPGRCYSPQHALDDASIAGFLAAARLPGCARDRPGRRLPGRPVGHARPDPRPGAPARRAHRRRAGASSATAPPRSPSCGPPASCERMSRRDAAGHIGPGQAARPTLNLELRASPVVGWVGIEPTHLRL